MGRAFWIGIVGGFFGIIGGVLALTVGSISESFTPGSGGDIIGLGIAALVFSLLGMVGGVFEKKKKIGIPLMVIAAIGVLLSISLLGVLSFIFFLIGAILIFTRKDEAFPVQIVQRSPQYGGIPVQQNITPQQYTPPMSQYDQTGQGFGSNVCASCGAQISQDAKFCSNCGAIRQ